MEGLCGNQLVVDLGLAVVDGVDQSVLFGQHLVGVGLFYVVGRELAVAGPETVEHVENTGSVEGGLEELSVLEEEGDELVLLQVVLRTETEVELLNEGVLLDEGVSPVPIQTGQLDELVVLRMPRLHHPTQH